MSCSKLNAHYKARLGERARRLKRCWKTPPFIKKFGQIFTGWQAGVKVAISISILTLALNIAFVVVARKRHQPLSNGLGVLVEGSCKQIRKWNIVGHAIINVLSTVLLSFSNYCMQLLASPTRRSVDKAHRQRRWVDIGIQSFRNVWQRHIGPWRGACWMLIALSSVPLHLLWNSVIVFSPSAFRYNVLYVTEGFTRNLPFNDDQYIRMTNAEEKNAHWPDNLHILQQDLPNYQNLSNIDCKREYAKDFVQQRADVIVVLKPNRREKRSSQVLEATTGGWGPWPYKWLCPANSAQNFKCYAQLLSAGASWELSGYESVGTDVQYCLSKPMEEKCKLEYGSNISIIVIVANTVKVACFIATWLVVKQHTKASEDGTDKHDKKLLVTMGDAIASFLEVPDPETRGMSIVEKRDFESGIWRMRWTQIHPMPWRDRKTCASFRAIGVYRWLANTLLCFLIFLVPAVFLANRATWFKDDLQLDQKTLFHLGLGTPSALFLFGSWFSGNTLTSSEVLGKVAQANTPQLVISIASVFWNAHLTAMIAAREYDQYAAPKKCETAVNDDKKKKTKKSETKKVGLRVTEPVGGSKQRETRFLTIPFRYYAVNSLIWFALHYFISQAIFFARVDILDHWLQPTEWSISQVGYSVLGLVCFAGVASLAFVFAFSVSVLRLKNRMPLAATCSGALSAACHPKNPGLRHHEKVVHWGVEFINSTEQFFEDEESEANGHDRVGHCTFTSEEAYYPEAGKFYA